MAVDAAGAGGDRTYTLRRAGGARRPRAGRGGPRRVRAAPGPRRRPRGGGRGPGGHAQADRRPRPGRRAAPAAARARAGALDRRPTTWRRRPSSSGRCCRPGCSSGSSWSPSWRPGRPTPRACRTSLTPVDLDLLDQLAGGPRPARSLAAPEGRAGLTRRLRALAADGLISLEWTLLGASAGPRYERWIRADPRPGARRPRLLSAGERPPGRPLGPRQAAALTEMTACGRGRGRRRRGPGRPPRVVGASPGSCGGASLDAEIRERPRRPLAGRPVGLRGGRPPATDLLPRAGRGAAP